MKKRPREMPCFEIFPSRGIQGEPLVGSAKLGPKPIAGLSHHPMTSRGPRGPPEVKQSARKRESWFSW
jgi:hypothetical protein